MESLPPIESVRSLTPKERTTVLDLLFEPCNDLHALSSDLLRDRVFESYGALIAGVGKQMNQLATSDVVSDQRQLNGILSAHPRLGEKRTGAQSSAEQKQLHAGGEEHMAALAELNQEYEKAFPGLRYVVFVNGRSRPEVMDDMRARIRRADANGERGEAIKAMCDIALDRARKLGQVTTENGEPTGW